MTVGIRQAQLQLADLARRSIDGEDVRIVCEDGRELRLVPEGPVSKGFEPGFLKGKIEIIEDDDEHLKDFSEYM